VFAISTLRACGFIRSKEVGRDNGPSTSIATGGSLSASMAEIAATWITRTTTSEGWTMMHNPPHPGEILRADYLEPLELSVTEAATALGVTRKTLSAVLNERAGISPAMAHRLSKALDTTPEFWVNLQTQYDLWQARETDLGAVRRLVSA